MRVGRVSWRPCTRCSRRASAHSSTTPIPRAGIDSSDGAAKLRPPDFRISRSDVGMTSRSLIPTCRHGHTSTLRTRCCPTCSAPIILSAAVNLIAGAGQDRRRAFFSGDARRLLRREDSGDQGRRRTRLETGGS